MRRILNQFKQWFKKTFLTKEVIVIEKIEFQKRGIDTAKMLPSDNCAQMWYSYVLNKYIDAVVSLDQKETQIYHEWLVFIKQIAEKNGYKVK